MGEKTQAVAGIAKKAIAKKIMPYVAGAAAVLFLVFVIFLGLMTLFESASVTSDSIGAASAEKVVNEAGLIDEDTYADLQEVTTGTSIPWQVLAVISYTGEGKTVDAPDPASTTTPTETTSPSASATTASVLAATPSFITVADQESSPLAWAYKQAGKHYRWSGPHASEDGCGSRGPLCYDCSGLTWSAFHQFGIDIGYTPAAQYAGYASYGGTRVKSTDNNLQIGDLVFWSSSAQGTPSHVGFYAGNGQIFDSANESVLIGLRPLHGYDSALTISEYAIRIPGAGDGVGLPDGTTVPSDTPAASASTIFTGGNGPFHLKVGVLDSEDFREQSRFVIDQLSDNLDITGFAMDAEMSADGEIGVLDDPDAKEAEQDAREGWVAALEQLPIEGMNETTAGEVYDRAKRWYLGDVEEPSSQVCKIVGKKDEGLDTTDGQMDVTEDSSGTKTPISLNEQQTANAIAMFEAASSVGAGHNEMVAMYITAMQESTLTNVANGGQGMKSYCGGLTSAKLTEISQQSQAEKHDRVAPGDCDSVGLFQQRPIAGWGSVKDLMNPKTATLNFLGAEGRSTSNRGVRQISGYETMDPVVLAQKVQGSRYPEAYRKWVDTAEAIIASMGDVDCSSSGEASGDYASPVPANIPITSPFGTRSLVVAGSNFHTGTDFGGPVGTPIYAMHGGTVVHVGQEGSSEYYSGAFILIDHGGGQYSVYNHMFNNGVKVKKGDVVKAGQQIAVIGNAGRSTGPHVHVGIIEAPSVPLVPQYSQLRDPVKILKDHGVNVG